MNQNTHRFDIWRGKTVKRTQKEISVNALETMELLEVSLARIDGMIDAFAGKTNPQIVETKTCLKGQRDAFEAALLALRGDKVDLRIYAGSKIDFRE